MKYYECRPEFKKLVLDEKGISEDSSFELGEALVIGRVPVPQIRLERAKIYGIFALDGMKLQELVLKDVLVTGDLIINNSHFDRMTFDRVRVLGSMFLESLTVGHFTISGVNVLGDFSYRSLNIAQSQLVEPITVQGSFARDTTVIALKNVFDFRGSDIFRVV